MGANVIVNLIVILVALYAAFLIYKTQTKTLTALTVKKEAEIKRNDMLRNIGSLKKQYDDYRTFINNKDVSAVINTISNVGMASSVKIVSMKPAKEQDLPLYTKYPFELKLEAKSFNDLGKFISKLESHQHIFDVEIAKIKPAQEGSDKEASPRLSAELKIHTIFLKNQ
jgi:Tfp pilus assembly protein PilO